MGNLLFLEEEKGWFNKARFFWLDILFCFGFGFGAAMDSCNSWIFFNTRLDNDVMLLTCLSDKTLTLRLVNLFNTSGKHNKCCFNN